MDYRDIQKLKVFFFALKKSNYKPKLISSSIVMNGALTPIDKPRCLELFRSFPDLEGKDDNQIFEALSDPKKIKNILGRLIPSSEKNELIEILEEKPVAVEVAAEKPSETTPVEQGTPQQTLVGEAPGTMGGGMPTLPSMPAGSYATPRAIHVVQQTKPPIGGKEGGTGAGMAATNKAAGLAAKQEIPSPQAPGGKNPSAPKLQTTKIPYSFTNVAKNFGSATQRFMGNAIGRGGGALGNFGLKAVDFGGRFSSALSTRGTYVKSSFNKAVFIFLGAFLLFALFAGLLGTLNPSGIPTSTSTLKGSACDVSGFDLFDSNAVSDDILNKFIEKERNSSWVVKGSNQDNLFVERAKFIRDTAKSAGLNPALFLAFWRSESGYSNDRFTRGKDLGCRPTGPGSEQITTFEESVLCAVGTRSTGKTYEPSYTTRCLLSRDANSSFCQVIKASAGKEGFTLPINSLDSYLKAYGPLSADPNNINTHRTVKQVISDMGLGKCTQAPVVIGGGGAPTLCSGNPVSFSNVTKKLLPLPNEKTACSQSVTGACGRPGKCVEKPTRIVLHTTGGGAMANDIYNYFANSPDGRGVGSHFVIGKDGETLQLVEMLDEKAEVAYAVAGYSDHISIEIVHSGVYGSKNEVPPAQYQATLNLVRALMSQYKIPIGNLDYDWRAPNDAPTSQATSGVYGHYQLNPQSRGDPGSGLQRDIKNELR